MKSKSGTVFKNAKCQFAILTASALTASLMPVPAMAAGTNYEGGIGGEKTARFTKYVVMDQDASLAEDLVFTYTVTEGAAAAYDVEGRKFQVLAGVEADRVTIDAGSGNAVMTFTSADEAAAKTDANANVKNYEQAAEKYMEKEASVDFADVTFPEPGVYRYVITEAGENRSVVNDANDKRYLDVYVVNDDDQRPAKKLKIAGFVLHTETDGVTSGDEMGTAGTDPAGKSQGFTNEFKTVDLHFKKQVAGNQASRDKYFKFHLALSGGVAGDVVKADLANADTALAANAATDDAYEGQSNVTSLTFGPEGSVEKDFYLQDGQEIVIRGLLDKTDYTVTETKEDYKSEPAAVDGYQDGTSGKTNISGQPEIRTSYKNTRNGLIPTGVAVAAAPFAGLTIFAVAGLCVTRKRRGSRS